MIEQGAAIIRRLFRNPNGDWRKLEGQVKEIMIWADTIEGLANDLAKADKKMKDLCLVAYENAPKKDTLYYDSPLSPAKVTMYLKMHLKKAGWEGVRDIHVDTSLIEPFTKTMREATRWLLKFKDDNEKAV